MTYLREKSLPGLDQLSRRLLELLAADPQQPASALARDLGVSAPTVRERIRRLCAKAGVSL